jgi:hypothetical protein
VTPFHHQPEAQHPKSSAINKPPADYPIFTTIICSMLLTATATAVPINPNPPPNLLTGGSDYTAAPAAADVPTGAFSFDYYFDMPTDVITKIFASSHQPFPAAGEPAIANLTLSWLDASFNPLPGTSSLVVTSPTGQTLAGTLTYMLLAGLNVGTDYILRVTGIASNSGRFDFDLLGNPPRVVDGLPLPGSIFLFSGGLACLAMLRLRGAVRRIPPDRFDRTQPSRLRSWRVQRRFAIELSSCNAAQPSRRRPALHGAATVKVLMAR